MRKPANESLHRRRSVKRRRRGAIIALVPVLILALAGIGVLMIDLGHITAVKSDAQNAADAATLAGALQLRMQRKPGGSWNWSDVANRMREFSQANNVGVNALNFSDLSIGRWNPNNSEFTTGGSFTDKNSVRATVKCDCDLFFAHVFGTSISKVEVQSTSAFDVSQDSNGDSTYSIPYVVK
ncbi:pilus assembly protein TadG-related protein [bacterium]|nr:pilus assembly protein TadG-related protein [bacterium]MDA7874131.1 pilus assembly protein TadG-related protein [Rhodopirellula sp.]